MDSHLSLDELFVSFPNQALKSRTRNRRREEESDVIRESSGNGKNSYDRAEFKGEIHSRNEDSTVADYVQANSGERESYASKLPSIRPVSVRQRNILKKERNREEFSCIDLDDFSGCEKPRMTNPRRAGKEGTIYRDNLLSPGSQHRPGEEKWELNRVVQPSFAKKKALDSDHCHNTLVYRSRQLSLGSSTDLHGQNAAERRVLFSPPVTQSPKPERPVDLSDKFTRFLEREFSIIQRESVSSVRSDSDLSQERESVNSDSTERSESVGKALMGNANRNVREMSNFSISTRRETLPSTRPRRWASEAKWESADSVTESSFVNKISSDSSNFSNTLPAKLDLSRRAQSLPSERRGPFTASQRDMSPRSSRRELEDRPLFCPSESRRHVQELPLNLPEKLAKFIEMEFSIIKGEDKSSIQRQKYGVPAETVSHGESPKVSKKSPSSLLQRRGRQENDIH